MDTERSLPYLEKSSIRIFARCHLTKRMEDIMIQAIPRHYLQDFHYLLARALGEDIDAEYRIWVQDPRILMTTGQYEKVQHTRTTHPSVGPLLGQSHNFLIG